jgi:hypothetical protein
MNKMDGHNRLSIKIGENNSPE